MSPRTLPVTPAERACATVLRAFITWNLDGTREVMTLEYGAMLKLGDFLSAQGLTIEDVGDPTDAGAALLARVEAAERTPEAVLRAMLAAYEADAIEKARAYYAGPGVDAALLRATNEADEAVTVVRDGLAILLAKEFTTLAGSMSTIGDDYAARLAGTAPIDAPPAKEPT